MVAASAPAGPAAGNGDVVHRVTGRAEDQSALFFDPKPRQLQSAAAGARRAALRCGMKSRSQSGSGSVRLIVGGRKPRDSASAVATTPAAPLAPCGWPIIDLVDEPGMRSASAPNAARVQRDSIASFSCVDVP